jgi:hypothetical protein
MDELTKRLCSHQDDTVNDVRAICSGFLEDGKFDEIIPESPATPGARATRTNMASLRPVILQSRKDLLSCIEQCSVKIIEHVTDCASAVIKANDKLRADAEMQLRLSTIAAKKSDVESQAKIGAEEFVAAFGFHATDYEGTKAKIAIIDAHVGAEAESMAKNPENQGLSPQELGKKVSEFAKNFHKAMSASIRSLQGSVHCFLKKDPELKTKLENLTYGDDRVSEPWDPNNMLVQRAVMRCLAKIKRLSKVLKPVERDSKLFQSCLKVAEGLWLGGVEIYTDETPAKRKRRSVASETSATHSVSQGQYAYMTPAGIPFTSPVQHTVASDATNAVVDIRPRSGNIRPAKSLYRRSTGTQDPSEDH